MVIESRMRFGSDKTVYYWLEPAQNKEKQVQTCLIEIFGDKESEGLYGTKDEIDDGEDFFPFIYVPGITL
jgi:V-type H+-transporting ATPase subunit C